MELYLAPWQWVIEGDMSFWQMPRADIGLGSLDLRSLPQCGSPGTQFPMRGWFSLAEQDDRVGHRLGDLGSLVGTPLKQALASRLTLDLGENIVASDTIGILAELLNHHADPTGQARWKPLRGSLRNGMKLYLANQLVWQDRFDADPIYLANTVAVFQEDYRRNRALPDTFTVLLDREVWIQSFRTKAERESDTRLTAIQARERWLTVLRKWVGSTMLKLWGQMSDELAAQLLPTEYRSDGWAIPDTVLSDNFNRTDSTTLGTSSEGWSWTEVSGNIDIVSNKARNPSSGYNEARAEADLASDDHYAQALVWGIDPSTLTRFSASARTFYLFAYRGADTVEIYKVVTGTYTSLTGGVSSVVNPGDLGRGESSDSDHTLKVNGTTRTSVTDTAITNNFRTGIFAYSTNPSPCDLDDFEAGDLAAAGRIMGALAGHGGLAGAGGIAGKRGGLAA